LYSHWEPGGTGGADELEGSDVPVSIELGSVVPGVGLVLLGTFIS